MPPYRAQIDMETRKNRKGKRGGRKRDTGGDGHWRDTGVSWSSMSEIRERLREEERNGGEGDGESAGWLSEGRKLRWMLQV